MPQLTEPANLPPPPFNGSSGVFVDATVRQTIHITQPAEQIRICVPNAFGLLSLPISGVTIALPGANSSSQSGVSTIDTSTLQRVTFSGNDSISIPNGALAVSDPLDFPVAAQDPISLSIYLATGQSGFSITSHPGSRATSWMAPGDQMEAEDVAVDGSQSVAHWYFISAVEGWVSTDVSALAIVGDSITHGRESDTDANNRWPDLSVARLVNSSSSSNIAVLNQAAGGNRILADGLGPNALGRIDRDVLAHSGVQYAMIFEGVNDIGTAPTDAAAQQAIGDSLLQAFDQIITRVHALDIPIFGATITPFGAQSPAQQPYSDPEREKTRLRVNDWIRHSGRFDYVVDFDEVVRNPNQPD